MIQTETIYENNEQIEPCNTHCAFCFLNYADILQTNYLFRNLSLKEIGDIIKKIRHQVREFDKGEVAAYSGDEYNYLMIIVKGSVVGEMMDFEGKILRIEHLKAPDTIASSFIFGDNNKLPVNVVAMEPTRVLLISRNDLLTLFGINPIVLRNYLDIMANRAQHLSKQIKLLGLHTIKGKLAHYLLEQMKSHQKDQFTLPHTQNELAEMFGVIRPSVARTIRELNDEGIIRAKGKNITIINRKQLSMLLK